LQARGVILGEAIIAVGLIMMFSPSMKQKKNRKTGNQIRKKALNIYRKS
jgi:hypothetical protein